MRCFLEVVSTPTAETPGTLLVLHFDDKRYLIGNLSEGSSRACLQHGVRLRYVNDIILSGRTEWSNIGGMLGMVIGLSDIQGAAAQAVHELGKESTRPRSMNIHGAPNLKYTIATARRFVFRSGMPINVSEHAATTVSDPSTETIPPTWEDDRLRAWAMPLTPSSTSSSESSVTAHGGRKLSFDQMANSDAASAKYDNVTAESIVQQMFNSDWKMDRLVSQPLKDVRLPAAIFIKDSFDGKLIRYNGPMPGGDSPVPDLNVFVRQAWPAARTEIIPPTVPKRESLCYVIRNHPQRGKFLPNKAMELEVERGRKWQQLSFGQAVKNKHGQDVLPQDVLGPTKQGGGFVLAEVPTSDYIASLESRPELSDTSVMDGVSAMIWILGMGVIKDPRIQAFQERLSHLRHIVSSPDLSTNHLSLKSASRTAYRNHFLDSEAFPTLVEDPFHFNNQSDSTVLPTDVGSSVTAQRGLQILLEPKFELDETKRFPPLDSAELSRSTEAELSPVLKDCEHLAITAEPSGAAWPAEPLFRDIQILTLGTGSSHPSGRRNVSGTLVRVPGCGSYLYDCGEGTLGTLKRMYTKTELDEILRDLRMIWISHLHADHHLGLTTMIKAWYKAVHDSIPGAPITSDNFSTIEASMLGIVSDAPLLHWLYEYSAVEDFGYSRLLPLATRPTVHALKPAQRTDTHLYFARDGPGPITAETASFTQQALELLGLSALSSVYVHHCAGAQAVTTTANNGFRLSYSGDCRPSAEFAAIGKDSHVLVHEATFEDDLRGQAQAKKHSTAGEALVVGREMNAQAVVLTHFSQRYGTIPPLGVARVPDQNQAQSPDALRNVLENTEDEKSSATAAVENDSGMVPLQKTMAQSYTAYIDEGSVAQLIRESGMRVVMAFDHMRLALKDLPRLEAKQPWMRAVYERLDVVDKATNGAEDGIAPEAQDADKQKTTTKQEKKRAKTERSREDLSQAPKRPKSTESAPSIEKSVPVAE